MELDNELRAPVDLRPYAETQVPAMERAFTPIGPAVRPQTPPETEPLWTLSGVLGWLWRHSVPGQVQRPAEV